jgi:hypothetical protein
MGWCVRSPALSLLLGANHDTLGAAKQQHIAAQNTHERTGLSTGTGSTLLEAHQALAAEVQDSGVRWGESYRVAGGGREDLCEHGGS